METKISAADLESGLSDVLDRIRDRGERFVVECDGEAIAVLAPSAPKPGITWGEFVALLRDLPRPDPGFADDLEKIHAWQGMVGRPEHHGPPSSEVAPHRARQRSPSAE